MKGSLPLARAVHHEHADDSVDGTWLTPAVSRLQRGAGAQSVPKGRPFKLTHLH